MSLLFTLLIACSTVHVLHATVQCNSTVAGTDQNGVCTGDYCFNIEDKILGCVNFYRLIRDDNIACGYMHLMGAKRTVCVCTQPYCGKYDVANMPTQTLAKVTCTDDTTEEGTCTPGPCYVGNDLRRYGVNATDYPTLQRTCMQDWFAVTDFKELIMYEVPPLANHSSCFFDGNQYNCMCKDPGCNKEYQPSSDPSQTDKYYTCHKMQCTPGQDPNCAPEYLGNDTCVGQMCYYLSARYNFTVESLVYNHSSIVRDCLNYSHEDPLQDLTFATGFEFGDSTNVFYPCRGDLCNDKTSDQTTHAPTTAQPASSVTLAPPLLTILSLLFLITRI